MTETIAKNVTSSIVTYSGKRVWPLELTVDDIRPIDIAHALSNLCRYNGHVDSFLSVAQHSCMVYDRGVELDVDFIVRKELLLHDGTEAYCGDLVAPLKHLDGFEFYRDLEEDIHRKICDRFNLPYEFDPIVKELDLAVREAEIRDLKNGIGNSENIRAGDQFRQIFSWSPSKSKTQILTRMREVGIEV